MNEQENSIVDNGEAKIMLLKAFKRHYLLHGNLPPSIYAFVKDLDVEEDEFFKHFNSFKDLERQLWLHYFIDVAERLEKDDSYLNFSIREKLLAFYFTFYEVIQPDRSFILTAYEKNLTKNMDTYFLKHFKEHFKNHVEELLLEGKETDEVAERPYIDKNYHKGFWTQFIFVLNFWLKDESRGFEKTDEAIEKAVHLSFDFIAKGPLDSLVDFAKFVYQNRG